MEFYYAHEKKKFDAQWGRLRAYYESCGMDEEAIDAIHEYDWDWFRAQRRYANHTQELPDPYITEDTPERDSSLFRKFQEMSVQFDESNFPGRYAWVDTVEDRQFITKLLLLSREDLELLTLYAIDGYIQSEIAQITGGDQGAISRRLHKLKEFLEK